MGTTFFNGRHCFSTGTTTFQWDTPFVQWETLFLQQVWWRREGRERRKGGEGGSIYTRRETLLVTEAALCPATWPLPDRANELILTSAFVWWSIFTTNAWYFVLGHVYIMWQRPSSFGEHTITCSHLTVKTSSLSGGRQKMWSIRKTTNWCGWQASKLIQGTKMKCISEGLQYRIEKLLSRAPSLYLWLILCWNTSVVRACFWPSC